MTLFRLIRRSLYYFRGVNAAVVAGVAVATAVIGGALLVGDSVRASLTDLAVQRLGRIDQALLAPRYFDASLADRLMDAPPLKGRCDIGPGILVAGGGAAGDMRTAGLQIIGCTWTNAPVGRCILNRPAAEALGLAVPGASIVLSIPAATDLPADATLAQRSRDDTLSGLRVKVPSIVAEPGMLSLFTRKAASAPRNAWVNLADLQAAVGRAGQANMLLVHDTAASADAAHLNATLRQVVTLGDYGLALTPTPDGTETALTSRTTYIDPPVEAAADEAALAMGLKLRKVSVALLNKVERPAGENRPSTAIHYAIAASVTPFDGSALTDNEAALNQWAADQLGAKVGDRLAVTLYIRTADGAIAQATDAQRGLPGHLRLARILPMAGLGDDPSLTPAYKGLTDADTVADWRPPQDIDIDKSLVTKADEEYWRQHKAAPKIFVNDATARRLWGGGPGQTTSIRLPAGRADEFARQMLARVDPAAMGLSFRPLRQEQLAAAGGGTDFGQLFLALSFFLIAAAALLTAMLLRLGVEQRARQIGVLAALGFTPRRLRRIVGGEGVLLALAGGMIGSGAAVGYTWLMMAGLRTWWVGAVGTTAMRMHVLPATLAVGFFAGQAIAWGAIYWSLRRVGAAPPARLLAGAGDAAGPRRANAGRRGPWIGAAGFSLGAGLIAAGILGWLGREIAFLAGGATLLAAGLWWFAAWLSAGARRRTVAASMTGLALRNAARRPARGVLSVALIALAAFALVTVAAMRQGPPGDTGDLRSGAGGYRLMVEADIPLPADPATVQGRRLLGFRAPADPIWDRVHLLSMRRKAGQDISCRNLTRPTSPTILAVPPAMARRGGFTFAAAPRGVENPWTLLDHVDAGNGGNTEGSGDSGGDIPIIADGDTAEYILHLSPGQTMEIADASGAPRKLRLVATLAGSIFQSQLLMGEENFRKLFPAEAGAGVVLVDVQPGDQAAVRRLLGQELDDYAVSVGPTAQVLAGYLEVQNTYLSAFEALGALGLMLGTIGLAVVLVRSVVERKAELALLASLGFAARRLSLVLTENVFLLVTGLALGAGCALVGVLPALTDSGRTINAPALGATLGGALAIGTLASTLAVAISGRRVRPADLRKE